MPLKYNDLSLNYHPRFNQLLEHNEMAKLDSALN